MSIWLHLGIPRHLTKQHFWVCLCHYHHITDCHLIPWRREWLPTLVFWPGEFSGQRTLAGYSPWGRKESDKTERLSLTHLSVSILNPHFYLNFFLFFFWPCHTACETLVSTPGIKLWPSTVEVQSPNHWTTRNVFSCFSCARLVANAWTEEPVHGIFPERILE